LVEQPLDRMLAEYAYYDALPSAVPNRIEPLDVLATVAMNSLSQTAGTATGRMRPACLLNAGAWTCPRLAPAWRIVGAGCEIPGGTPLENVRAIVDFARVMSGS